MVPSVQRLGKIQTRCRNAMLELGKKTRLETEGGELWFILNVLILCLFEKPFRDTYRGKRRNQDCKISEE